MRIGIIGAGNMGSAFAKRPSAAGHEITITARNLSHAEQAASAAGSGVRAVPEGDRGSSRGAHPRHTFGAAVEALRSAGDTDGKTVIDITNPLNAERSGLAVGYTLQIEGLPPFPWR